MEPYGKLIDRIAPFPYLREENNYKFKKLVFKLILFFTNIMYFMI
jgi:hypothetical protein